jgi:RHS repeat-associated protein
MNNKLTERKLHDPADSEFYNYDSAHRLVSFHRAQGGIAPLQSTWALDGVGNWKQVDNETRQHSSFNELISRTTGGTTTSILSDDNGNETDDGTFVYAYDAMNRLRTVTRKSDNAPIAVYSYDAMGRRIRKVVTNSGDLNGTTDFYLDGQQEIEERNAPDAPTQQYVYGIYIDEPLVADTNLTGTPTRYFYHQNTLYSVFALTDTTGLTVEGYQYDGYGRQTVFYPNGSAVVVFGPSGVFTQGGHSAVGNPYLFTGRRLDPETTRTEPETGAVTGLYYYRARYYVPATGRFMSRDSAGLAANGGNLYQYAGESPPNLSDPYGLAAVTLRFFGKEGTWNISLKLEGTYDQTKSEWKETKLSIPSASQHEYLSNIEAKLNIPQIGGKADFKQETVAQYYVLLGRDKLEPSVSKEKIPESIVREYKDQLLPGTEWNVLKGELPFTLVALTAKNLNCTFELKKNGLALVSGKTIKASQTGTLSVYLGPPGRWAQARVEFGRYHAISAGNIHGQGWVLEPGAETSKIQMQMGAESKTSTDFKESASADWFNSK